MPAPFTVPSEAMVQQPRSRWEIREPRDGDPRGAAWFATRPADLVQRRSAASESGWVHSFEVGSTLDGPGIRFVLFLTGCLLRCQYCHNPDTWHLKAGRRLSRDAILAEIVRYRQALTIARGGVTFSGGEPLLQDRLTMALVDGCRELGLHTALDTSGRLGARLSDAEIARIDLQLLDIKAGDEETHERVTRHPLAPTLAYARRLAALGRPTWIRFVLVPGLTDGEDQIERLADLIAELGPIVERVEVLRFHQMGRHKWEALELDYTLANTEPPDAVLVERVRGQFRSRGLKVY